MVGGTSGGACGLSLAAARLHGADGPVRLGILRGRWRAAHPERRLRRGVDPEARVHDPQVVAERATVVGTAKSSEAGPGGGTGAAPRPARTATRLAWLRMT